VPRLGRDRAEALKRKERQMRLNDLGKGKLEAAREFLAAVQDELQLF
jgi:hypothetical protein